MEIRFDPLNAQEAAAVEAFLRARNVPQAGVITPAMLAGLGLPASIDRADMSGEQLRAAYDAQESRPMIPAKPFVAPTREEIREVIAEHRDVLSNLTDEASAQSATPLPSAPLPAAADMFASAPAAAPATPASAKPVPPPPVPTVSATAAPSAPAASTSPAGDVDARGLPWDARIHSGSREKNKDGSWRQRRNLNDPDMVARVEAELRALMAVPVSDAAQVQAEQIAEDATVSQRAVPLPPPVPTTTPTAPPATLGVSTVAEISSVPPVPNVPPVPASSAPATAPIPSPPAVPVPPIAAAPAAPITFAGLMMRITGAIRQNKLTEEQVHDGLRELGMEPTQIGLLSTKPEALPKMAAYLDALIGVA
jgi:hypothetical protein